MSNNNSPFGHYNAWRSGPAHRSEIDEEEALMQRIIQEQVAAQNAAAAAAAAAGAGGTPPYRFFNPVAPIAPTATSASQVSGTLSVRIAWTSADNDGEGFVLQRSTNNGTSWNTLPSTGSITTGSFAAGTVVTYLDKTVFTPSTSSYRIFAVKLNVATPSSSSFSVSSSVFVLSGSIVP